LKKQVEKKTLAESPDRKEQDVEILVAEKAGFCPVSNVH
jgi:hypothetical protein